MKFTEKANKSNFYLIFDNCEYMNDRSAKFIRRLFINNDIRKALNNRLKLVFIENTTDNSSALSSLASANIKVEIDEAFIVVSSKLLHQPRLADLPCSSQNKRFSFLIIFPMDHILNRIALHRVHLPLKGNYSIAHFS